MKRLSLIAAVVISVTTFGQDPEKPEESVKPKQLLIGINISPDYCFRILKNEGGGSLNSLFVDIYNKSEQPKIGYTAGINACYNFSKHWGVETGLQYSNKGYASKKSELIFGDIIDPRYGFVYPANTTEIPSKFKIIYNYIYLDVPVRAVYQFGEKKIHLVASIGITTNILLNATQTSLLEYDNGDIKRQTQKQPYKFNSLCFSPTISIGADYKIGNKINLRAEPMFRYGLIKIIDSSIARYLWNSGFNITCYYALK